MLLIISCKSPINHTHDGSYSANISVHNINLNQKIDIIINGNQLKYGNDIIECVQFSDRIETINGKIIFNVIDGDLVINLAPLGKVKYIKVSYDSNL